MQQTGHRFCFRCGFVSVANEEVCPEDGSRLSVAATDPYIGKTLADNYEVLELLGRGGMSVVYKVRHLLVNRFEALKMLRIELVSDNDALQRFQQEVRAVSGLRHVNVVTVLDFGLLADDTPFLTMELLEGRDLGEVLKSDGPFTPERALPLFAQLCDGLFHAHCRGVIHRDIKPSNIIISKDTNGDEVPIIVDFGIAKLLAADGSTMHKLTTAGQVFGSPLYMSPEQCLSKRADERTDVYALGCVLYQTLAGVPPIQGSTPVETMMRQMQVQPRPFSFSKPDHTIPHAIELCVLKALAKDPEDRYRDMNEFRKALLNAANLAVSDLPGANRGKSTDFASSSVGTVGGVATGLRNDVLESDLGNDRLLNKPVFQIGMALILIGLIGVVAIVLSSFHQTDEDSSIIHAVQQNDESDRQGRGDRAVSANQVQSIESELPIAQQKLADPCAEFVNRRSGSPQSALAQAIAGLPACSISLSNLGQGWQTNYDLVNRLSIEDVQDDTVYEICFSEAKGRDVEQIANEITEPLLKTGKLKHVSSLEPIRNAGPAKNVTVILQTVCYDKLDARKRSHSRESYVVYYNRGSGISALQVVPIRKGNDGTMHFIRQKILPSFKPYGL